VYTVVSFNPNTTVSFSGFSKFTLKDESQAKSAFENITSCTTKDYFKTITTSQTNAPVFTEYSTMKPSLGNSVMYRRGDLIVGINQNGPEVYVHSLGTGGGLGQLAASTYDQWLKNDRLKELAVKDGWDTIQLTQYNQDGKKITEYKDGRFTELEK